MIRGPFQLALLSLVAAAAGAQQAAISASSVLPPQSGAAPAPASGQVAAPSVVPDDYQIGAGDVLQIIVWKEPEATVPSVVVRADGKVGLPFVKDVDLAGLTPAQAEQTLTAKLKPFLNEPDVSVIVREVHSKRIYVVGAVKREGPIDLKYPMTILQALTEAGGPTEFAKRKRIYILRGENGKQSRIYFNYDAVLRGEQMEQNIPVMPGDTLVVPH